jgi:MFS family permease
VLGLAAMLGVFTTFGWSYGVLLPVFAGNILHSGVHGYGYMMTATGVGALIGALLVASLTDYQRRERILFGGGLVFSAAAIAFALSRSLWLSIPLLAVVGLGQIAVMSSANTMIQISVPDEVRGRIMGVWALVFAGSAPLGSFQAGTIAQYLTAPVAVLIGAGITALSTVAAIIGLPRIRARRARRASDAAGSSD